MNTSVLSKSKLNITADGNNNDRMQKLADKLGQITQVIQSEKSNKFDQYEQKSMNIYDNIEQNKDQNNSKFNEVKEQILVIQKTLEDDAIKLETSFIDDLGADSLDIVELIMALEEEFDLQIPDSEAEKITTVGDVVEYIKATNKKA